MTNIISDKNLKNDNLISKKELEQLLKSENSKVYEVIRIINSKPLFLHEHVSRFNKSIKLIGLNKKYEYNEILSMINKIVEKNKINNNNIRMTYFYDSEHVLLIYFIKSKYPEKEIYIKGIKTITVRKSRKYPNIKIDEKKLRANIDEILKEKNVFESILIDENNIINEGSRSNIFFVKGNKLITPKDKNVLLGVTREKVIELCRKNNIKIDKRNIHLNEIKEFDGAFITGTSVNILPITQIDQNYYYSKNELIESISKLYELEVNNEIR